MNDYGLGIQRAGIIATEDEDVIANAAREAEERRIRANVLEDVMRRQEDLTGLGVPSAAGVEHRTNGSGILRPYAATREGAITLPVTTDRPLRSDEFNLLDAANKYNNEKQRNEALGKLYGGTARAQGNRYVPSGLLGESELSRRREAAYGDPGTESIAEALRATTIRRKFDEARAYGNGPTDTQIALRNRQDLLRGLSGNRAQKQATMLGIQAGESAIQRAERSNLMRMNAESELQKARISAEAEQTKALAAAQSELRKQSLINEGGVAVEGLRGGTARAVAEAEGAARVKAAEATASGVRDAATAKREREAGQQAFDNQMKAVDLMLKANRGLLDPKDIAQAELFIDMTKGTSEEKALRKKALTDGKGNEELVRMLMPMVRGLFVETETAPAPTAQTTGEAVRQPQTQRKARNVDNF